jgi:uncharacterized protein YfbU (UPF0304 family)
VILDKNPDEYQPYFAAFCVAKRIKKGDDARFCDYSAWIEEKHLTFRREHGYMDTEMPLKKEHRKMFQAWVSDCAQREGAESEADHAENS